jgi:hypothetical protein
VEEDDQTSSGKQLFYEYYQNDMEDSVSIIT